MTATYTVYSAEIAELLLDPESLDAHEDDEQLQLIEDAAGTYADALREAFAAEGLDVEVEVVHRTTGGRTIYPEGDATEDKIKEISDRTLGDMETLEDVRRAMHEHDRSAAPGSVSDQWHHFVEDARREYLVSGDDEDLAPVTVVTPSFAYYWHAIARGDYDTAEQYGEVPDAWKEGA